MHNDDRFGELVAEIAGVQWDIVMFSETRSSHGIIEVHKGNFRHICFGSGSETFSAGVAILLHERHAKNVANVKVISDRVMYVDFTVGGKKLRSIAAYAPHAGYSADDFNAFLEQVHVAILGACKDGRQTILGGDFNLQLQVGNRGGQIDALANAFGLTIANDDEHHSPAAETWTFCSSMGVKRRIDFILCSSSFPLAASHPSCVLDLGSDHTAVYARFQLGKACRNKVGSSRRTKRGWTPELDGTGEPISYHRILSRSLQTPPADLNSVESVCKYAAVILLQKHRGNARQTHCNNCFKMIISNQCWLKGGQQHADIEGRKYQKQFGMKIGENFGDKELNALNLCWRNLLH